MPKSPTAFHRPRDMEEALALLSRADTLPLGGGVKLLAGDVNGAVVDLQKLGLNQIALADQKLQVGATATLAAWDAWLADIDPADTPAPLLRQAIRRAGPNTYRNAATLGGTIARRLPDSELLALLLALEATLTLYMPQVEQIPLRDYLAGERPSALITAVHIPWGAGRGAAERVARTPADDPIVSVTLWLPAEGDGRLAATGVGERPCRLPTAEAYLAPPLNDGDVSQAALAAKNACTHPGDFRGDAAYRAEMAAVLTRRACAAVQE